MGRRKRRKNNRNRLMLSGGSEAVLNSDPPKTPRGQVRFEGTCQIIEAAHKEGEAKGNPEINMVAYNGGKVMQWWEEYPIIVDLEGMEFGDNHAILYAHSSAIENIIGQTIAVRAEGGSLYADGEVLGESDTVKSVVALSTKGYKWQASIGASPSSPEFIRAGETVEVNGQSFDGPVTVFRASKLSEISFVQRGADSTTSASVAASAASQQTQSCHKDLDMNFETWLEALELSAKDLSKEQLVKLEAKYKAEIALGEIDDPDAGSSAGDIQAAAVTAERERVAELTKLCEGNTEVLATAVKDGLSAEQTNGLLLEALRNSRPELVNTLVPMGGVDQNKVIEAGIAQALNLDATSYSDQVQQLAHDKFKGRMGLQQVLYAAALAGGSNIDYFTFKGNVSQMLKFAYSNSSLPGIMSAVVNKSLIAGYTYVDNTCLQIASTSSPTDYKEISKYRFTGGSIYDKIGASGEIGSTEFGEEKYTNQVDKYAQLHSITEKDIVNDDLGALSNVPRIMGKNAALTRNSLFWTEFLDDATFFTSGNANYIDGSTSALSIGGLNLGVSAFDDIVDADGNPMGLEGAILLTPSSLKATGKELMTSAMVHGSTSKSVSTNIHNGAFNHISTSYLKNGNISGSSATAWYLLADPMHGATIDIAFLNGQQTPTVESSNVVFTQYGIQFRSSLDIGVKKQDFRAGIKSKGTA